jgi:ATP-binding cassette subfamily B protein
MKRILKNNIILFKKYLEIDPAFVIIKLISSVFQVVQPLSSIWLFKLFLDGIFIQKSFTYCLYIILILVFINLLSQVVYSILNNRFTPISNQMVNAVISKQIMKKYLNVDLKELNNPNFYNKYTQVLRDFPSRVVSMQDTISSFLGNILSIATVITLMAAIDPIIIIISFVSIIANLLITPNINKLGYKIYLEKTTDNRTQDYVKRVFYVYDYIKELKLHSINNLLFKRYDDSNASLIKIIKNYSKRNIFFVLLIGFINILSFFLILIYLASTALRGLLSIGDVSALYNATEQLKSDALSFFSIIPRFMENSMYVEHYMSFMTMDTKIESNNGLTFNGNIKSIAFDNVSYSYIDSMDQAALNNINLTITENQKIALVGQNGAGKSTFVNLLTRLYEPLKGNIYVNGDNYSKINICELRKNFLVIFQDSQIYAATIAENVLMREVSTNEEEEVVIEALKKVDLYDKIQTLSKGIHSNLTKEFEGDGVIFSGGETQKLIVARVLASDAKIIILDEVTSNMDAISEHSVFEQIIQFAENKIVVYISHKLSTTKLADKIYVLESGKIIEEGNHKELMKLGGKYKEMFLVQAEKYGDGE